MDPAEEAMPGGAYRFVVRPTDVAHGHPALVAAARDQLDRVTLTSRAFHNDQIGPFL